MCIKKFKENFNKSPLYIRIITSFCAVFGIISLLFLNGWGIGLILLVLFILLLRYPFHKK